MSDDHDGGLARDLPLLTRRNMVAGMGLFGLVATGAYLLGGAPGQAEANQIGTAADGTVCVKHPVETNGPFPADGSNMREGQTVNALTQSGVVRDDLRPSFSGLSGVADGVVLTLDVTLVDVGAGCAALADHAIYLWHADAEGRYSLYDVPDQNYLRGVVVTDAQGRATVTTIVPGCYNGRWPHIHFEVFKGLDAAVAGKAALLTSQLALPEAACLAAYADSRYPVSQSNLSRQDLASDNVFSDNTAEQVAAQMVAVSGDAASGFKGTVTVGIVA